MATRLGVLIFSEYATREGELYHLDVSNFARAFDPLGPGAAEELEIAKSIFDLEKTGRLSESEVANRCESIYLERKHLSSRVSDLNSIVEALAAFLSSCVGFVMFFVIMILFSEGDYAQVTVSLGTTLLAFSFIISDTAKNVFNSFVFLFIRNPFDVGELSPVLIL